MKKWLIPLAGLAAAAGISTALAFAIAGDGGPTSGDDIERQECSLVHNVQACDDVNGQPGTGVAPVCAPEAPDCDDTFVGPGDGGAGPDDPVSSGPITIIDDMDPDECSLVHNIIACERQAAEAALTHLATRLGIGVEEMAVVGSEFVEWPNACLGVERPDTACAEVITLGFKVALEAQGQSYEYHTDTAGNAVPAN